MVVEEGKRVLLLKTEAMFDPSMGPNSSKLVCAVSVLAGKSAEIDGEGELTGFKDETKVSTFCCHLFAVQS